MTNSPTQLRPHLCALVRLCVVTAFLGGSLLTAFAEDDHRRDDRQHKHFMPHNLVISRSVYDNNPANIAVGAVLPPGCVSKCKAAISDGTYPFVWNNDQADSSFGITSKIFLDQVNPRNGTLINSLEVPSDPQKDHLVTSFPSKSELALNLSTNREKITFMGYVASVDAIDISNSNTPGIVDPTNPVPLSNFRGVAEVDAWGRFHFTETTAYSGNNGRAALLNNRRGANVLYLAGNAGNGGNPQPDGIIIGGGAQFLVPSIAEEAAQSPGPPSPLGSFSITQLGLPHDKIGKDTNFRGLRVFDNVVYFTKGSGGNGVNTVYFVDTTGQACPATSTTPGVGLPVRGASLPTTPLMFDQTSATIQAQGVVPFNMCILKGFPATLDSTNTFFPFGIWFADAHTLYVAQEGNGDNTFDTTAGKYSVAAAQTIAGLQKWIFDSTAGEWKLAYTLSAGLDLGTPYTITGYPTGNNTALKKPLPWAPATDGLRNITGRVNDDGTATIYAVTSTVSGNGDQGADPNKVVVITDKVGATDAGSESFSTLRSAGFGEVLRGVSFTPKQGDDDDDRGHDRQD
ncbi:MAG TPA: hypothetical protein VNX88_03085 [Terriglobales bacterium]|jgi:hypothetical protein|nr:hypothetical protein [Terriglobales bacterium]